MLVTHLDSILAELVFLVEFELQEELQLERVYCQELAEEMAAIAAFITLGEFFQFGGHVFVIRVLEEHIDLRLILFLITLIGHVQLFAGIAAEPAPKEHEADIALTEHIVVLILFALFAHGRVQILPTLQFELDTAPLECLVQPTHKVGHL